jgi:hypothetical protein
MGVDFSANIVFGCLINSLDNFKVTLEEEFHYEIDIDKKTKKELPKRKVIDQPEREAYSIDNMFFYEEEGFINYIAERLNYDYSSIDSGFSGWVIHLKKNPASICKGVDYDGFKTGPSYSLANIVSLGCQLGELSVNLLSMKVSCSEPGVFLTAFVG